MSAINRHRTITCTVPTESPHTLDRPWMNTVKVSVPSSESKNRVTPRWATVRPSKRTKRAFAQANGVRFEVSAAKVSFLGGMWG